MKDSKKLNGKDLINIGIFLAIDFVILFAVAMLGFIPIMIPMLAIICPLIGLACCKKHFSKSGII